MNWEWGCLCRLVFLSRKFHLSNFWSVRKCFLCLTICIKIYVLIVINFDVALINGNTGEHMYNINVYVSQLTSELYLAESIC